MRRTFIALSMVLGLIPSNADEPPQEASASRASFRRMMADPVLSQTFHDLQRQNLNTPSDKFLTQFLSSSPNFAPLYTMVEGLQEMILDDFSKTAMTQMLQINQSLTDQYRFIDQQVVDTAIDLGFSEKAIAAREVYISFGEANAFTVSGNSGRIIVVIQSRLLDTINLAEVRAVLAHELGHIRSQHTTTDMLTRILLEAVLNFKNKRPTPDQLADSIQASLRKTLTQDGISQCAHHGKDPVLVTRHEIVANAVPNMVQQLLKGTAPEHIIAGLTEFLDHFTHALSLADAPLRAQKYFGELALSYKSAQPREVNEEEFKTHAKLALNSLSQNKEFSADHYMASILPNITGSSAFAKLMGAKFSLKERDLIFKSLQTQLKRYESLTPAHERPDYAGGTHPSMVIRIASILGIPKFPYVLFANPFTRIAFLFHSLALEKAQLEGQLKTATEEESRKEIQDRLNTMATPLEKSRATLTHLIRTEILKHHQRPARLYNFLQYYLAEKELSIDFGFNVFQKMGAAGTPKERQTLRESFEAQQQSLRTLESLMSDFQKELRTYQLPNSVRFADLIDQAIRTRSLSEIVSLREALTRSPDGTLPTRRIPLDLTKLGAQVSQPPCAELMRRLL